MCPDVAPLVPIAAKLFVNGRSRRRTRAQMPPETFYEAGSSGRCAAPGSSIASTTASAAGTSEPRLQDPTRPHQLPLCRLPVLLGRFRVALAVASAAGASTAAGFCCRRRCCCRCRGRRRCAKLVLLHALVDHHGQIAAGCIDAPCQALGRRLDQEQQLREDLFLARHGRQLADLAT